MKTQDVAKIVVGAALIGVVGYVAYKFLVPAKELDEKAEKAKEQGVSLIKITLNDPSGARVVRAGQDITATVVFKNIIDTPIAPRFRLPLSAAGAPLWHRTVVGDGNEDWQRTPIVAPGDTISFDVIYQVPTNWSAGWSISVRLDMDGVGAIEQWDHAFDITAGGEIADLEDVRIEYFVV